jgi:site-specific recombinase XerD
LDRAVHRTEQQIFNRIVKVLRKVNRDLKEIGREAEISIPLTTYVARHTYATVLKREGVNVALISESLGHSNIQTTQIYLDSFENSQIDEAMKHLL